MDEMTGILLELDTVALDDDDTFPTTMPDQTNSTDPNSRQEDWWDASMAVLLHTKLCMIQ